MYDDLARTQQPTTLEWLVVNALIPSVLVTFALQVPLAAPRARPPQTVQCSLIFPPPEEARPDDPPDVFPVLIRMPDAVYPEIMRRAGMEDRVTLRALVNTRGRVDSSSVLVLQASNREFAMSARYALSRALFSLARFAGKPVDAWVTMAIEFTLSRE